MKAVILSSMMCLLLTACGQETVHYSADGSVTSVAKQEFNMDRYSDEESINQHAEQVQERIINSRARLAERQNSICPKLLQRNIDSTIISRSRELMKGRYCDYYIYPEANQTLSVDTNGANVDISLIMPVQKILNNVEYVIQDTRRHVIRVEYSGIQKMPDDFSYDISFNLE